MPTSRAAPRSHVSPPPAWSVFRDEDGHRFVVLITGFELSARAEFTSVRFFGAIKNGRPNDRYRIIPSHRWIKS